MHDRDYMKKFYQNGLDWFLMRFTHVPSKPETIKINSDSIGCQIWYLFDWRVKGCVIE
jgi:hypothetical protein